MPERTEPNPEEYLREQRQFAEFDVDMMQTHGHIPKKQWLLLDS